MTAYESTGTIADIVAALKGAASLAIVSHARPDGDAAGSILALSRALRALGKPVDAVLTGDVDPNILALAETGELRRDSASPMRTDVELAVLVDTGSWGQVEPLDGWLRSMAPRVLGIDHHARGDAIAALRVVDTRAASTTQIVARVIDGLGLDLGTTAPGGKRTIAEAIFVGLATDTGWFRYQNADAEVFALAARLVGMGVDRVALHQSLEENARPERLAVMARALASLTWHAGGRVAMMGVAGADFAATNATTDDLGGVVNVPLEVGAACVSILMTESKPGTTKVSFRSKPRADGAPWLNVSDFASQFGGGGHAFAAGAKFSGDISCAREGIERALARLGTTLS